MDIFGLRETPKVASDDTLRCVHQYSKQQHDRSSGFFGVPDSQRICLCHRVNHLYWPCLTYRSGRGSAMAG